MVAKVSDLLQQAAEVSEICSELVALPDPLNERQQAAVDEVAKAVNLLSDRMMDLSDLIENHRDQIQTVSHRLRTPLVTIQGYPEMLVMGLYGSFTDAQA